MDTEDASMRQVAFSSLLLVLVLAAPRAWGQESKSSPTQQALQQLRRALDEEQNLSPETRKAFQDFAAAMQVELSRSRERSALDPASAHPSDDDITQVVDRRLDERLADVEKRPWEDVFERLNIYGDLRLRHESSFNLDDTRNRHRERLRFRLRLDYQLSDEILLGGGIRTGDPDDPNSPFITLGDGFDDFDISLDKAFVTYRPAWAENAWITAGKFTNPIWRNPVYGELQWDADVNPEGVVGGYSFSGAGTLEQLDLMVGGYTVLEDATTDDVFALATQATGRFAPSEHLSATAAVGYYLYGDPTPDGNLALLADNAGNAVVDRDGDGTADDFVSDFGILNAILAFTYDGWDMPLTLSSEYILNTRARGPKDQGWALGGSLGRAKSKGDWRFSAGSPARGQRMARKRSNASSRDRDRVWCKNSAEPQVVCLQG